MRTIGRLTFAQIKNSKPRPGGKPFMLCDGGNLWLQIAGGKDGQINKSWVLRYATFDTKTSRTGRNYRRERWMGLGPLHSVGLADARKMAADARLLIKQGKDPLDERNASRAPRSKRQTFGEAADLYLERFEDAWKNAQHRDQWRRSLQKYVLPVLGKLDVAAIDTETVLSVIEPIWSKKPETASRVRGRIETVLDFAGRSDANPARWKGHLEYKLARRNKARTLRHLEALPYTEVAEFMIALCAVRGIPARALEFTILCAVRSSETLGVRWEEIDLDGRLWKIPAARTKRDREHRVPLSDAALCVLESMASAQQGARIFPIGADGMRRCLESIRPGITVHGFRSTFRSWAGACTTHPRDVCETALGHSIGSAVEQAYQRDALVAKRRVLMTDWAEFCAKAPADVVRIDVRKAAAT